ncbi:MAG TPA: YciI family protein [Saprospiraceae bacterium]|nr:YciI family protein [Saprospiraceae bacterium]
MESKKEFMLLFRYEPKMDYQPTEAEMNEMHQDWGAYFGGIASEGNLVSTHQLGFEGIQIHADKSTSDGIHLADNQTLGGNLVVSAYSLEEAMEIGKNCPILKMGGTVEVRSILPMD